MAIINMLGQIFWPAAGGMWESVLSWFYNGIGSYVWAIVVFTIVIKLILSPLDFMQRRVTAKNAKVQALMKPELEKLEKQCKGNKQLFNQKQAELYKKHNHNVIGSCVVMLVNLGVTMAVFFTLFGALNNIASTNTYMQYQEIRSEYYQELGADREVYENTQDALDFINTFVESDLDIAQESAYKIYYDSNESWGWVKSIFRADTIISTIPTAEQYAGTITFTDWLDADGVTVIQTAEVRKELFIQEYNLIMADLIEEQGGNGIYLLSIFAALVTAASQLLTKLTNRTKEEKIKRKLAREAKRKGYPVALDDKKAKQPGTGMIMMIVLPAIMLVFTLTSNAAFAIYIITSQLVSAATIPVSSLISRKIDERQEKKKKETVEVSYRRK